MFYEQLLQVNLSHNFVECNNAYFLNIFLEIELLSDVLPFKTVKVKVTQDQVVKTQWRNRSSSTLSLP